MNLRPQYLPSGNWRVQYRDDATGKRTSATFSTETQARAFVRRMERSRQKGLQQPERMRLGDWLMEWLAVERRTLAPRSYTLYEGIFRNHVIPRLGNLYLDQVTTYLIDGYLRDQLATMAPSTVRIHKQQLGRALRQAKRYGWIDENPVQDALSFEVTYTEGWLISGDLRKRLRTAIHGDRWELLWLFMWITGLRPSEALGLRWDDLDFSDPDYGVVHVTGQITWVPSEDGKVPQRKGVKAERRGAKPRYVVFPASVLSAYFDTWRAEQRRQCEAAGAGWKASEDWVFTTRYGYPPTQPNLHRTWKALLRRSGLPDDIRIYDLRKAYINASLGALVDGLIISKQVGHTSPETTARHYARPELDPELTKPHLHGLSRLFEELERSVERREDGAHAHARLT